VLLVPSLDLAFYLGKQSRRYIWTTEKRALLSVLRANKEAEKEMETVECS
jgi:hypothetical protein